VQEYGDDGANLVASHGPGPLLYSHLDTSLDGSGRDALVTGRGDPVGPLRVGPATVSGFGLGVARAPAAVALAAFADARQGSLLLAGSGTHRRGSAPTGVQAYLAAYGPPAEAVVAKCGPRSPLWEEPGAAYLTVRVTGGRSGAALAPASADPEGGVLPHAGVVLDAAVAWRDRYVVDRSARPAAGQVGAACGIGALAGGWPDKPDLLPASLELSLYVVTVPGEDVTALAAGLAGEVRDACAGGPLASCAVAVDTEVVSPAAGTRVDAPIVAAARAAWAREFGEPEPVTRWTGSTDGVVLRAAGADTVRLGPSARVAADDPRRDELALTELAAFRRIYRGLLDR
jgi:acetylornithine deacetylase/succinyl-diaminopimelate desuccinylase-like protein